MIDDIKVFYAPGDIVKLRHESIENRPTMLVKEKVEKSFKDREGNLSDTFIGIKCIWFDKNQVLQEAIFSTKDLMHI